MSDVTWIETYNGELLNLNTIAIIKPITRIDKVEVLAIFDSEAGPVVLTVVSTQEAAKKVLHTIGRLIKTNVRFIDSKLIAEQAENERD